nr:hypothetical protein [Tanacetum cinerariifolium]
YYATDDELPTKKVSQELMEEMSQTVYEVKLRKVVNEMLRQRCTSGDEHQYHIDQMQNFLKNDIVDLSVRNYVIGHILHVHPAQASPASAQEQQYQLYLTMKDNPQLQQDDLPVWLALKYKFERLHVSDTSCRPSAVHPRDQDDPRDDAHLEGENSAKR